MKTLKFLLVFIALLVLSGCFPTLETQLLKKEALSGRQKVDSPSKVFLTDASMVIFDAGFTVSNNYIIGLGTIYSIDNKKFPERQQQISLDSVLAVTVHEKKMEDTRLAANTLLYVFGIPTAAISAYCVACPKCCFGSCPTVYSNDGTRYNFETELFSYSIARQLEENDLDLISQPVPENGIYNLKVTNEALETHFINRLSLIRAKHPLGTKLFPSSEGKYILIERPEINFQAVNSEGTDVTSLVNTADGNYYRSNLKMVEKMSDGICYDWIDIKTKVPENTCKAKIVMRYRNTLLSTVLFYEVVLGSQGLDAINWTNKMNSDEQYASQFNFVYQSFSGIRIYESKNNQMVKKGRFADAGPLNWKYSAEEFSCESGEELNVRLKFVPDNFMIDYIAFDFADDPGDQIIYEQITPDEIKDGQGKERNDIKDLLKYSDEKYLVTNPGESFNLCYRITKRYDCEQTIFIESRGFYNEWIRGNWVRNNNLINSRYTFNLFDFDGTVKCLVDNWLYGKDLIEKEFFKNKIPLRGAK